MHGFTVQEKNGIKHLIQILLILLAYSELNHISNTSNKILICFLQSMKQLLCHTDTCICKRNTQQQHVRSSDKGKGRLWRNEIKKEYICGIANFKKKNRGIINNCP